MKDCYRETTRHHQFGGVKSIISSMSLTLQFVVSCEKSRMLSNGGYKTQASSDFQLLSLATTTTNNKGGARKMRAVVLLGVILLIPFCCCQKRYSERTLPPEERNALRKINEKLNIGWNLTVNPCITNHPSWFRNLSYNGYKWEVDRIIERNISCYCDNITNVCHVTKIYLMGQNLTGTLPEEFGNLTSLEILYLSRNYNISGTIPAAAWASAPLKIIMLIGNRLTGMIPEEIGRIATLQELILENNLLYGPIPEGLGKLTGLKRLLLSSNNFVGELPESLGNLKNLTDLRMDGNGISGSIPYFIGNLTNLRRLDMQGTSMKGAFPSSLSELKNLEELRVSDFSGDGKFPHLEHAASMTTLTLRNCSISEKLPVNITLMQNLKNLDLSFNNIFGEIPANYISLARHIENMFLNNNRITGLLPDWIAKNAKSLDVSYNNFTGSTIPLGRETNKNFVASFPSQDGRIDSYFKRNLPCPGSPENYELYINCGGSKVKIGKIEYEDDLTKTGQSTFHVSESKRWAYSSTGVFTNGASQYIISNETTLSMTDSDLYSSARLSASSLSYYGLCLQKGNYTVNLSFAEIHFTSDHTFASQGRRIFDVLIQGQLKKKDFNIAEAANGTGRSITLTFNVDVENSTLEINLRWAGKGTNAIPWRGVYGPLISAISVTPNFKPRQRENKQRESKKLSFGVISAISFPSATMILLIVIFLSLYMRRRRTKNKELERFDLLNGCYSLKEIKLATDGFNSRNKIGEGGFGAVYKGVLPSGTAIAVKQLSSRSCQGNHEFVNEIGIVSALQHPNLVKLLGCCIEGNQLLLIYEYMKNNCLARALFGPQNMKYKLDWKTRCKICLGMARGLAYLHEESRLKIVHRDIKPSNILLDEDLNAKISDFGLAKLYEDGKSQSSTRIAGTVGYMAPEYTTRGHLTYKADVYSFGVVMLEILSGKSNANYWADEGFEYLLDWADALKKDDRLLELVDPILGSNYPIEEAQQLLTVSLACTNKSPSLRPKMSDVVMILQDVMHVETSSIVHSNILMFSEEPEPRELCLKLSRGKKNGISPSTDDL